MKSWADDHVENAKIQMFKETNALKSLQDKLMFVAQYEIVSAKENL